MTNLLQISIDILGQLAEQHTEQVRQQGASQIQTLLAKVITVVQVSSLTQLARICPGRYFAENSVRCVFTVIQDKTDWERQIKLFISIASVLAAFDIKKAKGEDGISITPSGEYISSFIR